MRAYREGASVEVLEPVSDEWLPGTYIKPDVTDGHWVKVRSFQWHALDNHVRPRIVGGSESAPKNPQSFVTYGDKVNHPSHYKWLPVEAIEITEHFNFCMGNALKYIIRADRKGNAIEDLEKARWYIDREIAKRKSSTT